MAAGDTTDAILFDLPECADGCLAVERVGQGLICYARLHGTSWVEPSGSGTRVLIHSDVKLAGAIAQYGRGAGMIQSVASQLIGQFGAALKESIAQSGTHPQGDPVAGVAL